MLQTHTLYVLCFVALTKMKKNKKLRVGFRVHDMTID
jgi:hypothetical protein